MYMCGCLRMSYYASWQNFTNMASPANLAITARTASKFCARSRSQSTHIFDLALTLRVLLDLENLGHVNVCTLNYH